ncbi:MAG: hypothetical protein E7Y34_02480, partial [Mycoplasma sp.]|nr:hypothetical protein [Mycoplasma sp.]
MPNIPEKIVNSDLISTAIEDLPEKAIEASSFWTTIFSGDETSDINIQKLLSRNIETGVGDEWVEETRQAKIDYHVYVEKHWKEFQTTNNNGKMISLHGEVILVGSSGKYYSSLNFNQMDLAKDRLFGYFYYTWGKCPARIPDDGLRKEEWSGGAPFGWYNKIAKDTDFGKNNSWLGWNLKLTSDSDFTESEKLVRFCGFTAPGVLGVPSRITFPNGYITLPGFTTKRYLKNPIKFMVEAFVEFGLMKPIWVRENLTSD